MRSDSIWKKMLLLTIGGLFAFHVQMATAQDETSDVKTSGEDEECVITDDQYKRIN